MKVNVLCGALLAVAFSASAGAQTCASPVTTWHPDAGGSPDLAGSTCGNETGILSTCSGANGAPSKAYVARVTIAAQPQGSFNGITLTDTSGGAFHALLAVVPASSPCPDGSGDVSPCATSGDTANPVQHTNISPGDYFLIVTGNDLDIGAVPGCGTFTLHADGTLPVTLQGFTVS
jgi:hypothetical protein